VFEETTAIVFNSYTTPRKRILLPGYRQIRQESRAVARKPRDAAAVLFGLKFADNIRYKFTSSQASKARLGAPNIQAP